MHCLGRFNAKNHWGREIQHGHVARKQLACGRAGQRDGAALQARNDDVIYIIMCKAGRRTPISPAVDDAVAK
jgi:hypothetical protein